jgi:cleavage and polyadenylation specificity factor subunit 1
MSAYTIHQELFPPQTVEQVERCRFTSLEAVNLVVAKASLLQIYEFVEYVPEQQPQAEEEEEGEVIYFIFKITL